MVSGCWRLALWPGWLYLDPRDSLGRLAITSVILSLLPHLKKKRGVEISSRRQFMWSKPVRHTLPETLRNCSMCVRLYVWFLYAPRQSVWQRDIDVEMIWVNSNKLVIPGKLQVFPSIPFRQSVACSWRKYCVVVLSWARCCWASGLCGSLSCC